MPDEPPVCDEADEHARPSRRRTSCCERSRHVRCRTCAALSPRRIAVARTIGGRGGFIEPAKPPSEPAPSATTAMASERLRAGDSARTPGRPCGALVTTGGAATPRRPNSLGAPISGLMQAALSTPAESETAPSQTAAAMAFCSIAAERPGCARRASR